MSQYIGMSAVTGRAQTDQAHIQQSVSDILMTPIGTRIRRREYGSLLPDLIDQPFNPALRLQAMSAAVMALMRWEPRIKCKKIDLTLGDAPGASVLDLAATRKGGLQSGQTISLSIPLRG